MAVSYSLEGPLLRMELAGTYDPEDVVREFEAAVADPRCPDPVSLLVDVTRSESLASRSPSQIRFVAESLGPYVKRINGRVAVVAIEDLHFGFSRMGSAYSENVGVEAAIFRDPEEARRWLGV
ncbi:MAG TPA: hypothetical protein VFP58_10305 [Candidatus Eisenbacteria bacterium]|nr:hypothetical protein [Candidatus Eisenbacteria bacterium]